MARVSYTRGSDQKIKDQLYKDGRISISKDKHKLYLDTDYRRKELSSSILIDNVKLDNWIATDKEVYCEVDLSNELVNDNINFYNSDTILMVYGLSPEYYQNNIYCSDVIDRNKLKFIRDTIYTQDTILSDLFYCYSNDQENGFKAGEVIIMDFPKEVGYIIELNYNEVWFSSVNINQEQRTITFISKVDSPFTSSQIEIIYNPKLYYEETCQILIQLPSYGTRVSIPEIEVIPEGTQPEDWIPTTSGAYIVNLSDLSFKDDDTILVNSDYGGIYNSEIKTNAQTGNTSINVYSAIGPDEAIDLSTNIIQGTQNTFTLKPTDWENNKIIIPSSNELDQITKEQQNYEVLKNSDTSWKAMTDWSPVGLIYFEETYKIINDFFEIEFVLKEEDYNKEEQHYIFTTDDNKGVLEIQGFIGSVTLSDSYVSKNDKFFGGAIFKITYNGDSEDLIQGKPINEIAWKDNEYGYHGNIALEFIGKNTNLSSIIFNYETNNTYNIISKFDAFGNYIFIYDNDKTPTEDIIITAIDLSEYYHIATKPLGASGFDFDIESGFYIRKLPIVGNFMNKEQYLIEIAKGNIVKAIYDASTRCINFYAVEPNDIVIKILTPKD